MQHQFTPIVMASSNSSEMIRYKALPFLIILYFTIMLISVMLVYKIVIIKNIIIAASTLVIPLWYFLGDVIAEVYGYKISKQIIWACLFCEFIFIFTCVILIKLPSPIFWHNQAAYDQILGKLPRIFLGSLLGIISSSFINAYAIARWKVILKGKYFWLRSICISAVGEIIFTIVTISIDLFGVIPLSDMFRLIAISYGIKLVVDAVAVGPTALLANILKKIEGVDVYESDLKLNLFAQNRLTLENSY